MKELYHHGGHDTEAEAAAAIWPHLNAIQTQVLAYARSVWPAGFTQKELSAALNDREHSTYRTRVSELVAKHLLVDTGVRRQHPPSKRRHIVWRFKPHQLRLPLED